MGLDLESLYAVLLVAALVMNGLTIAGATRMRTLLAPVREYGLVARIFLLDLIVVPAVAVGLAVLLDVDPVVRAGLVIVGASSCGAIGMALTRIAKGDVPLSVTLVVGLGTFNLITVPLITSLLFPDSIRIPLATLIASLLGLAVAPLLIGRVSGIVSGRLGMSRATSERLIELLRRGADVTLAAAVSIAFLLEPRAVAAVITGPVLWIAIAVMLVVTLLARAITVDPVRVRTISVVINARAVGLALAIATIHLGDVPGLRATVLAYGGLTQVIPVLVALAFGAWARRGARTPVSG
jgi:bile acid:Na+ symporter, BASS family